MSARPVIQADTLELILQEIRGLRADLAAMRAPRTHDEAAVTRLVACISRFAGPRRFSTWALLDFCTLPDSGELRDAIRAAVGSENGKKLGRLLKRLENVDLDGLRVIRDGDEGGTARWRVSGFETP